MRKYLILAAVLLGLAAAAIHVQAQDPDPTRRDLKAYKLRVGDSVNIVVYGEPQLSRAYTVPGNGEISFPPVGKIALLGLTPFDVEDVIAQKLKDADVRTDVNVGCIVDVYAPRTAFILGSGTGIVPLPVHREVRLLEFLAVSNALQDPQLDLANVQIRRLDPDGNPFTIPVNVDDILERNMESKNVVVFEGDVVKVRRFEGSEVLANDFVYVLGKVGSPGRHPIIRGRTPFTLTKLIALTGDFLEFADRSKVRIIRYTATGRQTHILDFDDVIEGDVPDFELQADDLIYVPESFF